jgi:phage major head subunit gpT-like protein
MSATRETLSSRAVVGMYYERLQALTAAAWIDAVSNYFTSDQPSEEYAWLNMPPTLREWIGGRQAKGLTANGIEIKNRHFEATLEILLRDLRRDKTGQLRTRMSEFAERGLTHFASLLSTLIVNGESTVCYDGQYFFDTDHSEGASGSQSNDITTDISELPASVHGAATAPSPEEMQQAILKSIAQMHTLVDDQGEPINELASQFLVMVPVGLSDAARSGLSTARVAGPSTFDIDGMSIRLAVNPRLTAAGWTDKFATFRTDGSVKPLIRQEETRPTLKVKDENSEFAFDNDAIQLGLDTWRNVGYGRWQGAVLNTLV